MAQQSVQLTDRRMLLVDGVKNVLSFDEQTVILDTTAGQLYITGEGLHITTLNLTDSKVDLQGSPITALEYREQAAAQMKTRGQSLLKRILK